MRLSNIVSGIGGWPAAARRLALLAALGPATLATEAAAQVGPVGGAPQTGPVTPAQRVGPPAELPGFPGTGPAPGVVDNPNRIFGTDAPDMSGVDLLGAIIGGFGFSLGASLITEYNDNIARTQDGEPLPGQFRSRDDWRFVPAVNGQIARPLGRQRIFVNGSLGYAFHARNTQLDRTRSNIDGGLQWALGTRCSGLVSGGWAKRDTRDIDFLDAIASAQTTTRYGLNAGCSLPSGLGFNAGVQRSFLDNEAEQRRFADSRNTAVNGSIFYRLGQRATVSVNGFSSSAEFPGQLLPDGSANGLDILGFSLGGSYQFGRALRANAQIGRSYIRPDNPASDDSSGTTWNVGLTYSGPRLGANMAWSRQFSIGRNGFAGSQQATGLSGTVTYRANERLGASAGYARNVQSNFGEIIGQPNRRLARFADDRFFAGVDFRLNRLLTISADVNHLQRSTNPAEFGFDATRMLLTLRASI